MFYSHALPSAPQEPTRRLRSRPGSRGDATNATKEFIDHLLALAVNAGTRPDDFLPVPVFAIEEEPPPLLDLIRMA